MSTTGTSIFGHFALDSLQPEGAEAEVSHDIIMIAEAGSTWRVADRQNRPAAALAGTPVTHCTADDCVPAM